MAEPIRAPLVLEGAELVGDGREPGPDVAQGQCGPVGEVALCGRAVSGEVAQRELGERVGAVEAAGLGRPFGEQRIRVIDTSERAATDQPRELCVGDHHHEALALRGQALVS